MGRKNHRMLPGQQALEERHVALTGSTTDGSARSPAPLCTVVGEGPPQLCPLPVLKALTQGVVQAVATARARLATSQPTWQRGRPSSKDKDARCLVRTSTSMPQNLSAVFQARCLCVTRRLTPCERQRLMSITHGWPHLRTRREIMEAIDALFDRRGQTPTTLGKLRTRRHWGQRFTWIGDT